MLRIAQIKSINPDNSDMLRQPGLAQIYPDDSDVLGSAQTINWGGHSPNPSQL